MPRRWYRPYVVPVHSLLAPALAEILRRAPLSPEKVAFAWRQAAGATMERATRVELRDGVLTVSTRDAAWAREVGRAIPTLRPRLDAVLGPGVVRRIDVASA